MEHVGRTASAIAQAVSEGRCSARAVVEAHLAHLAEVEHRLGAFVTTRAAAALAEADAVDQHPELATLPLAGVPVAIQDVIDLAGEPTRHGSLATSQTPAASDHPLVRRLKEVGAIIIGKTRGPELSLWGTSDDPGATVISPWDPTRSAGGSSGGSAAAVAAGVVPLAVGTDGLASVRIPAAACGVVGFRPGAPHLGMEFAGRPHRFGMTRFGPLATTVADAVLLSEVLSGGRFALDSALAEPLEVAVSWRAPAPGVSVSGAWREAALEAGRLLHHAGHEVTRADPPYDRTTVRAVVARWTQGAGQDVVALELDPELLQPRTRAHIAAGERLAKVAESDDDDDVRRWRERLGPFFADHDVLLTPAFARAQPAATAWHTRPWAANIAANLSAFPFTAAWNLADVPSVVLPLWEEGGRPLAVQVVADAGREDRVLAVAALLESMVPRTRHAPGWGVPG